MHLEVAPVLKISRFATNPEVIRHYMTLLILFTDTIPSMMSNCNTRNILIQYGKNDSAPPSSSFLLSPSSELSRSLSLPLLRELDDLLDDPHPDADVEPTFALMVAKFNGTQRAGTRSPPLHPSFFHPHNSPSTHTNTHPTCLKHLPKLGKQPMKRRTIHHNLQHRIHKTHVARVDQRRRVYHCIRGRNRRRRR